MDGTPEDGPTELNLIDAALDAGEPGSLEVQRSFMNQS